jgi:death-on-curing protein
LIAKAHAFSDANKRTGLATCIEYLSLNQYSFPEENENLANAMVDLVLDKLSEKDFADLIYTLSEKEPELLSEHALS